MHILLTNDDGFHAKGIQILAKNLRQMSYEVSIVAPLKEKSASSHSITLKREIRVDKIANNEYTVDGTPVDSVIIAIQRLVTKPIDLVISGINSGQNMGEDIHYSGTVAAAKEAAFFGYKAIAVSINEYQNQHFETAAICLCHMLKNALSETLQNNQVLNINVPNVELKELKGIRLTSTGHRKYYNFINKLADDDNGFTYVIGGDAPIWDYAKGSDAEAVLQNFVSLTPLGFDMTKGDAFPILSDWLDCNENNLRLQDLHEI
jgi:5'-nucleotidase